jgi:hypothetical protein
MNLFTAHSYCCSLLLPLALIRMYPLVAHPLDSYEVPACYGGILDVEARVY